MPRKEFEIHKIRRLLKTQGHTFTFKRAELNAYKEPTGEKVAKAEILGVYHETVTRLLLITQESSKTRSLPKPSILCLTEDLKKSGLAVGDEVSIGANLYKVQGAVDIQKMGVASDISLEMVENNGLAF